MHEQRSTPQAQTQAESQAQAQTQTQAKDRRPADPQGKEQQSLKGTFVSVMLLGAFLAVTWIGVFLLFVARD